MAGLLDALNSDEGMQALGLLAAAGPSATPMSFGQRLFGAMQQDQARRTEAEDRKMRQQMQQMQMQQLEEAAAGRRKAAEQEQQRASYLGAIDSSQGPPMQMSVPRALASGLSLPEIGALMPQQTDPMAGFDKVSPKDYTPESLAAFVQTRNPAVLRAVQKDDKPPADWQLYQLSGAAQRGIGFDQWDQARRRAGATNLSVNTDNLGLKPKDRFEMEQKLAGDYMAATKLDRGIVTTAQDITNILKQGGALKDQAAIYKFAKALDPDGAVREADYAAIVQTAGGIGYVQALFNKALTGEQLLPRQRQEMINITQSMANVAQKRIENQRSSLSRNARQYNLTPENIFAPTETLSPTEGLGAVDLQAAAAAELKRRNGGR